MPQETTDQLNKRYREMHRRSVPTEGIFDPQQPLGHQSDADSKTGRRFPYTERTNSGALVTHLTPKGGVFYDAHTDD